MKIASITLLAAVVVLGLSAWSFGLYGVLRIFGPFTHQDWMGFWVVWSIPILPVIAFLVYVIRDARKVVLKITSVN